MKRVVYPVFIVVLSLLANFTVFGQRTVGSRKPPVVSSETSVKYTNLQAQSAAKGVLISWQTESELNNLGFLVYRVTANGRELAGKSIVPGSFLKNREISSDGGSYSLFDPNGNSSSQYVIENIGKSGQKQLSGSFYASSTNLSAKQSDALVSASTAANINGTVESYQSQNGNSGSKPTLTDLNKQRIIAATPGVKIAVKKDGLYRVTRAQLASAGFNLTGSIGNWQLYLNGIEQSIIVEPGGNYLEFYGKGIDTNEADTQNYFLIAGTTSGKRMATNVLRSLNSQVNGNSYYQTFVRKERTVYASGILNGDLDNHFGTVVTSSPGNDVFSLSGVDFNSTGTVTLEVNIQGLTTTDHQVSISINNNALAGIAGSSTDLITARYQIPAAFLAEGNNTLRMSDSIGVGLVESIRVSYNRKYQAQNNNLFLTTKNYKIARLDGFSSANVRVFDMANVDSPVLATNVNAVANGSTFSVNLPAYRGKTFFAVEDSGVLSPVAVTTNTPSTLSTINHNATFLIVSHGNFLTQSEAWANYRRGQGFSSEVVNIEDVYDEFNFGTSNADSIRSFLQYAKTNWQTKPQYVLFVGDASYDPRGYEGRGTNNLVPTKIVDTIYLETGSDEALADFNDDGLSEMAVGRIPARTGQVVTDALNKVQSFEATVSNAQSRGALFVSDSPVGYDFEGVSTRLSQQLPASMPKVLLNRDSANASTTLLNELRSGKFLVNYSGHGNAGAWSTGGFFLSSNIPSLTNSSNLTIYTMLTCLNGYFIDPGNASNPTGDSMSELLLKSTVGGAVSVWSSTGLTTPDIQEVMANRYYSQITAGNITRLGDLINDAKTTIPGGRDVRLSWCLLGDPMLKVK